MKDKQAITLRARVVVVRLAAVATIVSNSAHNGALLSNLLY